MTSSNLTPITAGELMTREVVTASPETPVGDRARRLLEHQIGGMPVVDGGGTLVGMVSGFDVISKAGTTTAEIMSRGVVSVTEESGVGDVVGLMGLHGIRRVPVVANGRIVGIISRSDLLRHYVGQG
ncbi:MAG: CBS domain-containing protein [Thermomicrobiales bacterium]|nr:CBS domain-containing protein [Thermomicrobiales bacterium]